MAYCDAYKKPGTDAWKLTGILIIKCKMINMTEKINSKHKTGKHSICFHRFHNFAKDMTYTHVIIRQLIA